MKKLNGSKVILKIISSIKTGHNNDYADSFLTFFYSF